MYTYAILEEAYASVLQAYQAEERSPIYVESLKKARRYLRKGWPVTPVQGRIYEVYSLSEMQKWAKGEALFVTAYEVTANACSCFEAHGFGKYPTCAHQQIVVLNAAAERLVRWYAEQDRDRNTVHSARGVNV
jgi:hypothetical protein